MSLPCAPSWHTSWGKNITFSALVWEAAFQRIPAWLCSELWPVQPSLCLCPSSPGSDWSCKWNTPRLLNSDQFAAMSTWKYFLQSLRFLASQVSWMCLHHPCAEEDLAVWLECALCNWTSSLKNTPAILPVLALGYEACDAALGAGEEKALPRGISWANLITLGFEMAEKEKSQARNKLVKQNGHINNVKNTSWCFRAWPKEIDPSCIKPVPVDYEQSIFRETVFQPWALLQWGFGLWSTLLQLLKEGF